MIMNNFIMYFFLNCLYVIGDPYVSDQAGFNRCPLIQNRFIVTLYTIHSCKDQINTFLSLISVLQ